MDILFCTNRLEKECNNKRILVKRFGAQRSKLLKRRLAELSAANVLEDLRDLPQARCHELHGKRKGKLSVDLDGPYRLVFKPANDPLPKKSDGGLDWTRVTAIMIIGVEDTHE
jgi:proteic killer suppression protein